MSWNKIKGLCAILLLINFFIFLRQTEMPQHTFELSQTLNEHSLEETGSVNVATGIYLDYRVYDSLFESLLLLISAVGIHYFNKEEEHEDSQ